MEIKKAVGTTFFCVFRSLRNGRIGNQSYAFKYLKLIAVTLTVVVSTVNSVAMRQSRSPMFHSVIANAMAIEISVRTSNAYFMRWNAWASYKQLMDQERTRGKKPFHTTNIVYISSFSYTRGWWVRFRKRFKKSNLQLIKIYAMRAYALTLTIKYEKKNVRKTRGVRWILRV